MTNSNSFKVEQNTITLTVATSTNTLTAETTELQPASIDIDTFNSAVWSAIKKAVKSLHLKTYINATHDTAVVNAVYKVTYNEDTKTIVIPLIGLLQGDDKNTYNSKATMFQTATAKFINTVYETPQQRSKARLATEKSYKVILQWAFDFLTEGRKDGVKISANDKDVDIISGMLLKLKAEKISTTGEKTIQAYIEYAFRQKIAGKDFFVNLYSVVKEQDEVKVAAGEPKDKEKTIEPDVKPLIESKNK